VCLISYWLGYRRHREDMEEEAEDANRQKGNA